MDISNIYKIKAGKLETFLAWCKELSTTRKEEALKSFGSELVRHEKCILLNGVDGSQYIVGLVDKDKGGEVDMSLEVNKIHTQVRKECLEMFTSGGKVLYDLEL